MMGLERGTVLAASFGGLSYEEASVLSPLENMVRSTPNRESEQSPRSKLYSPIGYGVNIGTIT